MDHAVPWTARPGRTRRTAHWMGCDNDKGAPERGWSGDGAGMERGDAGPTVPSFLAAINRFTPVVMAFDRQ